MSNPSHRKILGIGAPIIDYILNVSEEYLEKLPGAKGGMLLIDYETLQKILSDSKKISAQALGGSAANTIRGLSCLGNGCSFLGKVGDDEQGHDFVEGMNDLRIKMLLKQVELPTSQVACLITPDKERTMRAFLGASKELKTHDLESRFFHGVDLVHLEGYTILDKTLASRAMELARENKAKISFDLGSFEVVNAHRKSIIHLLSKYIDVVIGNQEEVRTLTQLDPEKACGLLGDLCETAVVLMGEKGCWTKRGGKQIFCPANKVKVKDTTGAGDLFASGFLHAYLQEYSIEDCAKMGTLIGGAVVEIEGVDLSREKWELLKKEIQKFPLM